MSADPRESSASQGDDLFDLPSEAPRAREISSAPSSAAGMDVDKPSSALPRRAQSTTPAGPPLTNVQANAAGIEDQVRARPKTAAPVAPVAALPTPKVGKLPKLPKLNSITGMWIAFVGFALVAGWGLGSIVVQRNAASITPSEPATAGAQATASQSAERSEHAIAAASVLDATTAPRTTPVSAEVVPVTSASPMVPPVAVPEPTPVISDAERLEAARAALASAREDMAAGRRGAARARLARIGLTADAIQPSARDSIRVEAALLSAQCIQADADEAGGKP